MEPSDQELLTRYGAGDVQALQSLVERYRRPLFAYIRQMTRSAADADEAFQETWFRAIRKLDSYREKSFLGWLARIAHNLVIDTHRRRRPEVELDRETGTGEALVTRVPSRGLAPDRAVADAELGQRLRAAADALPADQREVFLLRAHGDLPFKEIARIQRVSINTALARMQYALTKLRVVLGQDYRDAVSQPVRGEATMG